MHNQHELEHKHPVHNKHEHKHEHKHIFQLCLHQLDVLVFVDACVEVSRLLPAPLLLHNTT